MFKRVKEQLMPSKFSSKSKENQENKLNVSLSDFSCPICLEILVEPVGMPCKHEICLKCFDTMLDQSNLCCPMCRLRISTWSRTARTTNTLINLAKWKQIQQLFPKEVKNRLEGKPTESLEEFVPLDKKQRCASQGEIRQEYLELLKREEERLRQEKENEERLSRAYIEQVILRENASANLNEYLERQRLLISNAGTPNRIEQRETRTTEPRVLTENQNIENVASSLERIEFATPAAIVPIASSKSNTVRQKRPYTRRSNVDLDQNDEFVRVTRSRSIRLSSKPDSLLNAAKPQAATTPVIEPTSSTNSPSTSRRAIKRVLTLQR